MRIKQGRKWFIQPGVKREKRSIKVKKKIDFNPKKMSRNRKMNKKVNRIITVNKHKRIARNKKDKKLYVWFLMGVLCLLGIGAVLLTFLRSKQKDEPVEDIDNLPLPEIKAQTDGQEKEVRRLAEEEKQETVQEIQERKKKRSTGAAGSILYLLLVLGICIVPLLLFWLRPVETTAENRTMAVLPEIWTAEGFNWNVLSEAGAYFTDHFFLRQEMVSINAGIRSEVFGISPVEDVIVGENGWLYYAATLDDYQHKNSISERMLFNAAHNTALMQEYTEGLGKTFVFTIAPNKNSLYDENMPKRLRYQVAEKSDAQRLLPWLVRENVNYVDLFALFEEQEETLYYARDSHWNEKGAVMVYHALLDVCGKQHETFEGAEPIQNKDYFGDLGVMLFPVGGSPEVRLQYPVEDTWYYVEGEKAEDQFVRTANEKGEGNLLMYRDSFGNSLLPYMAQTFSQTVFSRQMPYAMSDLVTYEPDILIVEKVERQLPTLGKVPPVMGAPIRETEKAFVMAKSTAATVNVSKEGSYWKLEGLADPAYMDTDSRIYVEVDDGGGAKLYEAFCVSSADTKDGSTNDYGYILYVAETQISEDVSQIRIRVITEQEEAMQVLRESKLYVIQNGTVDGSVKLDQEAAEADKDQEEAVKENSEGTDKEIDRETGTEGAAGASKTEAAAEAAGKTTEKQAVNAQKAEEIQTEAGTQATQGQTSTGTQPVQSKITTKAQATEAPKVSQAQPESQAHKGAGIQPELQVQQEAELQPGSQVQQGAEFQPESQVQQGAGIQPEPQAQRGAELQLEPQVQQEAETQAQTAVQQQTQQTVTEVSRIYMEDCGSDSGYWVITYSDGHVEYVDD